MASSPGFLYSGRASIVGMHHYREGSSTPETTIDAENLLLRFLFCWIRVTFNLSEVNHSLISFVLQQSMDLLHLRVKLRLCFSYK